MYTGEPKPGGLSIGDVKSYVGRDDAVIVEVGANNGGHSRQFAKEFPNGKIFCFEPDKRAVEKWKQKTRAKNVQLFETAVGAVDGFTQFYVSGGRESELRPEGWTQSGSIRRPTGHVISHPEITFTREADIPIIRLDTWFEKEGLDRIDFLWADVQGAEIDLIEGGRRALSLCRYFYTEYSNNEKYEGQVNIDTILESLPNFEIEILFRGDVLLKNTAFA